MTAGDARLDAIQARLDAATPGPWFASRYHVGAGEDRSDPDAEIAKASFKPDAEFIANAPADVAFLLAELREAREALTRVEAECRYLDTLADGDRHYAKDIRAAVAAANGDGNG